MKLLPYDLPSGKKQNLHNTSKIVLFIAVVSVTLFTIAPLYYPLFFTNNSSSSPDVIIGDSETVKPNKTSSSCDLFTGEWVPNPAAPYYTNETCVTIYEHQNCMKNGRPDLDFLKWRWQPDDGCELPIFDTSQFLETVQGKSLAFVGDSVARNQMQSLICLLSRVASPVDITYSKDQKSKRWKYTNFNFTIANFWSPFLVKAIEFSPDNPNPYNLYLDEFDESWTTKIHEYDYVIISGGHWFNRPLKFYENSELVGCLYCSDKNVTNLKTNFGYRRAFQTAFRAINSLTNFKGITFLRTYAPSHFENGVWNAGGDCVRRRPFMRNETHLEGDGLEIHRTQLEEFKVAEIEGVKKGLKFRLLDTTQAMLVRPDGHPSRYDGRAPNMNWPNDCVHWCLPGPIDTWNDLLLEMLKRETGSI